MTVSVLSDVHDVDADGGPHEFGVFVDGDAVRVEVETLERALLDQLHPLRFREAEHADPGGDGGFRRATPWRRV